MDIVIICNTEKQAARVIEHYNLTININDILYSYKEYNEPIGINITIDKYSRISLYKGYPDKYSIKSFKEFIKEAGEYNTKITNDELIRIDYVVHTRMHRDGIIVSENIIHKELYTRLKNIKYIITNNTKLGKYKIVLDYMIGDGVDFVYVNELPKCINSEN